MLAGAVLVSTLVLGIILLMQGKLSLVRALGRKDILKLAALGLLNPSFYYLVLFRAYDLLPGQVAQPLNMTWPIVLVLISIPILKQKIGKWSILAMVISFGGVIVLSLQGGTLFEERTNLVGVLLALSTALLWALYWIFNMKNRADEVVGLFVIFLFASLYMVAGGLLVDPFLPQGREAWLASAYIGVFEMGLAFVLWFTALRRATTTASISNLVFLAPFLNLVFVHTILGETIYISTIFGIVLVVGGIFLQNRTTRSDG